MRIFIAGVCARPDIAGALRARVELEWPRTILAGRERFRVLEQAGGEQSFLIVVSNDTPDSHGITDLGGRLLAYSGYAGFEGEPPDAFFKTNLTAWGGDPKLRKPTGGIAAFCLLDPVRNQLTAWSTQPPVEPIYYASNDQLTVVSNRPLPAHWFRTPDAPAIQLDEQYLWSYLLSGFAIEPTTPYVGVRMVPAHRALVAGPGAVRLAPHPNPAPDPMWDEPLGESIARGVYAMAEAIKPLRSMRGAELMLSGGKDSRLLAAAVTSNGVKPLATTFETGVVEMQAARGIAKALKLEHRIVRSTFDASAVRHNVERTLRCANGMLNCEAQVDTYDPMAALGDQAHPLLLGHAHLQKGGFVRRPLKDWPSIRALVHEKFDSALVVQDLRDRRYAELDAWMQTSVPIKPLELLYWANHDFRVGRYLVPHYHHYSHRWLPVYPMVDESFARFCATVSLERKASERLVFGLISKLAPSIRDAPLVGKRWRFESSEMTPEFAKGYAARAPLAAVVDEDLEGSQANHGFWTGDDATWHHVRDTIMSSRVRTTFEEIVRKDFFETIRVWKPGGPGLGRPTHKRPTVSFVWRLYQAAILYEGGVF